MKDLIKLLGILMIATLMSAAAQAEPILMIGDSLSCGPFGQDVLQNLSKAGNKVTLYCAVSSAPQNWLAGKNPGNQKCQIMTTDSPKPQLCGGNGQVPKLASILAAHRGERVIVGLGTNSLLSPKVDNSYHDMLKAIQANGSKCDWIGPPHLHASEAKGFTPSRIATEEKNLPSFYESLSETVEGHCNFIDSRDATAAGTPGNETGDGIHRTPAAGKYWADAIQNSLIHSPAVNSSATQNIR